MPHIQYYYDDFKYLYRDRYQYAMLENLGKDILFSSSTYPLARHILGSILLRLQMDSHEMQSHRYRIPHLEIKSDENFEEQTRRAAAFFGTAGASGGTSAASKIQRFYFPVEYADNAYKGQPQYSVKFDSHH